MTVIFTTPSDGSRPSCSPLPVTKTSSLSHKGLACALTLLMLAQIHQTEAHPLAAVPIVAMVVSPLGLGVLFSGLCILTAYLVTDKTPLPNNGFGIRFEMGGDGGTGGAAQLISM